jgi:hypothetical protein
VNREPDWWYEEKMKACESGWYMRDSLRKVRLDSGVCGMKKKKKKKKKKRKKERRGRLTLVISHYS